MTWLNETEPFALKPHITRKRIMCGLTPAKRKAQDRKRRLIPFNFWHVPFLRSKNAKATRKGNGSKEWGYERDAWGKPDVQDKSSRYRMRLIASWWQEIE